MKNTIMFAFIMIKITQLASPAIVGRSWASMLSESVLGNRNYVENILATFEKHPKLGILTSPEPYHSVYIDTLEVSGAIILNV